MVGEAPPTLYDGLPISVVGVASVCAGVVIGVGVASTRGDDSFFVSGSVREHPANITAAPSMTKTFFTCVVITFSCVLYEVYCMVFVISKIEAALLSGLYTSSLLIRV